MSQQNVEVVTRVIAAFNRGDLDAALKDAAPDFEVDNSRDVGEWRGIHTTPDQVRRMWESFVAPWESFRIEIDEFIEACEDVVVTRQTGYLRGRDGIEVTARTNWVWTIRDGAIRKLVSYNELDEALEAAGSRQQGGTRLAIRPHPAWTRPSGSDRFAPTTTRRW